MKFPRKLQGQRIIDSECDVILIIEPSDVRRATSLDPLNCAAARALKRQLGVAEVCIMRARSYINYGSKDEPVWTRYLTSEPLAREIVALDRGGHFEPGTYVIKAPTASQRLGTHRNGKNKNGRRTKNRAEPPHRHVTANVRG